MVKTAVVTRRSYGVVPVALSEDGSPLFLVLRAYKNWDFPKGGADEGEAPIAAAIREMKEETGIAQFSIEEGSVSMDTAIYAGGKVASYYVARVEKQEVTLPVSAELGRPEHDEYRWVSYEEAKVLLAPRLMPILNWAFAEAAKQ